MLSPSTGSGQALSKHEHSQVYTVPESIEALQQDVEWSMDDSAQLQVPSPLAGEGQGEGAAAFVTPSCILPQ